MKMTLKDWQHAATYDNFWVVNIAITVLAIFLLVGGIVMAVDVSKQNSARKQCMDAANQQLRHEREICGESNPNCIAKAVSAKNYETVFCPVVTHVNGVWATLLFLVSGGLLTGTGIQVYRALMHEKTRKERQQEEEDRE